MLKDLKSSLAALGLSLGSCQMVAQNHSGEGLSATFQLCYILKVIFEF